MSLPPNQPPNPWMRWRSGWFLAGLVGVLLVCHFTPIRLLFDQGSLIRKLQMAGGWGVSLFITAHVVATVLGLPGTILVIAGGAVFGLVGGTVWSVMGATLGAIAAFYVARCLLHDWIDRRFGQRRSLQKLHQMVRVHRLRCVLMVRFAPISPFNVVNFLFGLTPIDGRSYAIGTFLGIIPGTLAYTWLGVSGMQALHGEGAIQFGLALSLLAMLSVMPIVMPIVTPKVMPILLKRFRRSDRQR